MAGPLVAAVTSEVDALILKSKAFFSNKDNFIRELLQLAITTYMHTTLFYNASHRQLTVIGFHVERYKLADTLITG